MLTRHSEPNFTLMPGRTSTFYSFFFFLSVALLVSSCHSYTNEILRRTGQETHRTSAAITITEHGLFPEGIEYDDCGHRFLVSSLTRGTIGAVDYEGNYESFIEDEALAATVGIEVDEARQRLLVCVSDPNAAGTAALGSYDLLTGERHFLTDLTAVAYDNAPHFANDVTVDQQGNAYVTDSFSPIIYKVDPQGVASVFLQDDDFRASPGEFGLNGIVFNPNEFLIVAFSERGLLYRIPMNNPQAFTQIATEPGSVTSPDGLYLAGDAQMLMVVNNDDGGVQGNMIALGSDDHWASTRVLDRFKTGPVFPTTVAQQDDAFYVLYTYLDELFSGDTSRDTFEVMEIDCGVDK